MIAVDSSLLGDVVKIFVKKEPVSYDKRLQNLIRYIIPPVTIGSFQIPDVRLLSQSGGIVRSVLANNEVELVSQTNLKIILSDSNSNFPFVNINSDEFETNFTATYTINSNKLKLYEHIESLIKVGNKIEIFDKYLLFDNGDTTNIDNSHYSIKFVEDILNNCGNMDFTIFCKSRDRNQNHNIRIRDRKNAINTINHSNNVIFDHNTFSEHDRYIRIYKDNNLKYEIILSSGIFNILNPNKDISYIVRIIN